MVIGMRIKHARKKKQYSQAQLADLVGVSQPTIGNWESGNHVPRLNTMGDLADALGVKRLWLISGIEKSDDPNNPDPSGAASENPYLTTPIVHVAVHIWPKRSDDLFQSPADRYIPASLWALQPFALEVTDEAMSREFSSGTLVIFDAARTELIDGQLYLFNWNGSLLFRRWRSNPSRLEASAVPGKFETIFPDGEPVVIASALQAVRDLI